MAAITTNPTISLARNLSSPWVIYFGDGAALFGCVGNPEGVVIANKRSICIDENGVIYTKTTDGVNTGWTSTGSGGGTIGGSIANTQVAVGSGANTIAGSSAFTFSSSIVSVLGSGNNDSGFFINQSTSGTAANAGFYTQTTTSAGYLRQTSALFTAVNLLKPNQMELCAGTGSNELLFTLADASKRFVFGIANAEAASINATTTENIVAGAPSTAAVPQLGLLKFYNTTNANYLQFRATAFGANRIWDLPTGSPTGTQALVGSLSGSTITLSWGSVSASLTATQIGFGDGSNLLSGSSEFTYDNANGVIDLTKTLNSSVRYTVTNSNAGNAAQARFGVSANVSGGALIAYSSAFTTSGLRVANSVVLDMDGPTAVILGQAAGTFKVGLGVTEYLRLTSTVLTLFGSNSGSVTGISVTSAAAGSGVTIAALSSGSNEALNLSGKGAGNTVVAANQFIVPTSGSAAAPQLAATSQTGTGIWWSGNGLFFPTSGTTRANIGNGGLMVSSTLYLGFASGSADASAVDAQFTRVAAASIRMGAADAATAIAQTLGVQGVVAGTSNTAGVTWTFKASASTGNVAGGSFVFQTTPAGSSGTNQNAFVTALTITGAGFVGVGSSAPSTAQFEVTSQSSTRLAGLFTAASGASATQRLVTFQTNTPVDLGGVTCGGSLVLTNLGTAPSASVTDACLFYAADAAATDANYFVRAENGAITRISNKLRTLDQDFNSVSTTQATIAGSAALSNFSFNLEANKQYTFRAVLHLTTDATGGFAFKFNGGSATVSTFIAHYKIFHSGTSIISGRITSFSSTSLSGFGLTSYYVEVEGYLSVNAAGTYLLQFAQNSASSISSVLQGSSFSIEQSN